eukprot:GFUD01084766.1.p1 GENE.GFUD01084766.1~~GFUD01084766.1.p1  ORF type:complete len:128 (-),score=28.17 GFUD01084766.1:77-460(-)
MGSELCDNDPQMSLLISVFDYDSHSHHDLIGSVQLTLADMQTMAQSGHQARLGGGEKEGGLLSVTECMLEQGEGERRVLMAAYPASKGCVCPLNQDDPTYQEFLIRQAQAQELLSQGQNQCPRYQEH